MKRFCLIIAIIFILVWPAEAQKGQIIEVFPPDGFADLVFVESSGHITSFTNEAEAFYILTDSCRVDVYLRMPYESYRHFQRFDLCEDTTEPALPTGVECLGFDYPGTGTFTVDGYAYAYDGHLSFIVPFDALWTWNLFIEDVLVLRFEQTEAGNCHVVQSN